MTSKTPERNVIDELSWDPMIDGEEVAVSAYDGTITLRGAVDSFREKYEARQAAVDHQGPETQRQARRRQHHGQQLSREGHAHWWRALLGKKATQPLRLSSQLPASGADDRLEAHS
jgi:BON domain